MLPGIIRTIVPIIVGYFLAWPVAKQLGLSDDQVTSLVTAVVTAGYYVAVRLAEQYFPQAGWLLGWASAPKYAPPSQNKV